jgi:phage terminase Nu1 subunit (DNA packaging protein)
MDAPSFSRPELARLFDVSTSYVSRLVRDGVVPAPVADRYPASAITAYVAWLRRRRAEQDGSVAALKRDQEASRAKLLAIKAGREEGRLVELDSVIADWTDAASRVRARLLSIPTKCAPLVAAETSAPACQQLIEKFVHAALAELSSAIVESAT